MNPGDFFHLLEGDKVIYKGGFKTEIGTVLTRKYHWMDDGFSLKFEFEDDFHFFNASDVEVFNG